MNTLMKMTQTPGLVTNEESPRYVYRGAPVVSVTEVLEDNGFIEKDFYTEEGKVRGQRIHLLCQFLDEGRYSRAEAERFGLAGYVESWLKLKNRLAMEILDVELAMAHPRYIYAGRPDRRAQWRGRRWLLDLKSGGPEMWHGYQTGGYQELYEGNGESGPLMRAGVHLKADGSIADLRDHDDMNDRHHFLSFLDTTHQRRLHGITHGR